VGDAKKLASTVGILSNKKIALWETVDEIKERLSGDEDALFKTYLAFSEDEEEGGR
jgi:G:T/U-mismatch repair DNA glycosylase